MGIDKQPNGSFKVTVMIERKSNYLGYFTSYAKAVEVYNNGKKKSKNNTGRKIKQAQ